MFIEFGISDNYYGITIDNHGHLRYNKGRIQSISGQMNSDKLTNTKSTKFAVNKRLYKARWMPERVG